MPELSLFLHRRSELAYGGIAFDKNPPDAFVQKAMHNSTRELNCRLRKRNLYAGKTAKILIIET